MPVTPFTKAALDAAKQAFDEAQLKESQIDFFLNAFLRVAQSYVDAKMDLDRVQAKESQLKREYTKALIPFGGQTPQTVASEAKKALADAYAAYQQAKKAYEAS